MIKNEQLNGKIIGIDLGTTNSVVAVTNHGATAIIAMAEGGNLCPSVVSFNKKERLIGSTAKRQAVINPENTFYSVKRFIGRAFKEVEQERRSVAYTVSSGKKGEALLETKEGRNYTAQEISAMILSKLKQEAEAYLGETVTQAVITVPAYFNDSQRQATKDAGKIAGLEVLRIINEPTAAALAYGIDKKKDETVLVFDLGGGTFDLSVLEVKQGVVEVLATRGDTHLGGDDWDQALVNYFLEVYKQQEGIDLRPDRTAMQRLREAAEKAKIELSSLLETEVNLPYITADLNGPKHFLLKINRAKFEQLTAPLLLRLDEPFAIVLKDAKKSLSQIDEVLLVGGSTRMPIIQNYLQKKIGQKLGQTVNLDEVVAAGAAIQGGVLAGEIKDVILLDVTPLSLGIETAAGLMAVLIERNSSLPVSNKAIFSTDKDGQLGVDIKVLQGERLAAADNKLIANFSLEDLPPAPRGVPQIEVTFYIDANGILTVTAKDLVTQIEQKVTVTATTNLEKSEIDKLVLEAKMFAEHDRLLKELALARNKAEEVIYQTENLLAKNNRHLTEEKNETLQRQLSLLKTLQLGDNAKEMAVATQELHQNLMTLGAQIYAKTA